MIYNVHLISHLADDCIYFTKPLNWFSTFPFETELGKIVDMINGLNKPLAQLVRCVAEREELEDQFGGEFATDKYFNDNVINAVRVADDSEKYSFVIMEKYFLRITFITDDAVYGTVMTKVINVKGGYQNFFKTMTKSSKLMMKGCTIINRSE